MSDKLYEYTLYPFVFEAVSVSDIASFAYGQALSPDGIQVQRNNRNWFIEWSRHKLAWINDVRPSEVEFRGFDVFSGGTPDNYYFTIQGKWMYKKETR